LKELKNLQNSIRFLVSVILIFSSFLIFAQAPDWFNEAVKKKRAGMGLKTAPEFVDDLWDTIYVISTKYELPPTLIAALISIESNFANVKGPGGVLGMMQILPSTAKGISKLLGLEVPKNGWEELLTNYKLNITYGTAYISYLYKKHGTFQKALEEYNNGKNKTKYAELILKQYKYYDELHTTELSKKQSALSQTSVTSVSNATSTNINTSLDTPQSTESVNASESIFPVLFGVNKDK